MTTRDLEAELERDPFVPLRLRLVSGKTLEVSVPGAAWVLRNAVLVFQNAKPGRARVDGYDVIALRNIERLEQVLTRPRSR
jgi:hypothetical protein